MSLAAEVVKARIIWRLSHSICVNSSIFIAIESKKRFYYIFVFVVMNIAINFASMELVVTVLCFEAFQFIRSLNNLKQYSLEL